MNTVTNFVFWYCAVGGIKSVRKNGHDFIFEIAYWGYLLVGIGSFMFHTSLKYPWQLVDELNMIYTTCLMGYANLSHAQSTQFRIITAVSCILLCTFVTLYYHYLQDPNFHQNVYAAMTVALVFRSAYQMEVCLRPTWRHSTESDRLSKEQKGLAVLSREEQEQLNSRDLDILRNMWILVCWGVSVFLAGFALWGMDIKYCGQLRARRRQIGLPWGALLELHGWWHVFTGYGAYCYIVWGIHLRHILKGDHGDYEVIWPRVYNLPELVKKSHGGKTGNGTVLNGHIKKNHGGETANGKVLNGHIKSI